MTHSTQQTRRAEGGFTLVELAIVMIIIGLLIGGILKGQELVNNARISSSVSQEKGIEAAINTFTDQYKALPGDILVVGGTPSQRLPNCGAAVCNTNGDGNGQINGTGDAGAAPANNEAGRMFVQLAAAGMVTGVDPSLAAWPANAGGALPNLNLGGNVRLSYNNNVAPTGIILAGAGATLSGHYIAIGAGVGNALTAANLLLPVAAVANIDRKLDDGNPNTGSVLAVGTAGNAIANCVNTTTAAALYNEQLNGKVCGLYIRAIN